MSKLNPTNKQKTIEEITEAAKLLPEVLASIKKKRFMSGADLLLINKKTVGGKPIDPNQIYEVILPEWRPVNHKDEMVKIYTESVRTMTHEQAYEQVCEYIIKVKAKFTNAKNKKHQHATA